MELASLADSIRSFIEEDGEVLHNIALDIYNNPELGNDEYKSAALLCGALQEAGFEVQMPYMDLATAFKATLDTGKPGGEVGLLCEYDALPGIGHGCGHNLIGVMSVGAARALASIKDELSGKIMVFGCPAEETNGAKVPLSQGGAFDSCDAIMQVHPGSEHAVGGTSLAIDALEFIFTGRTAHASGNPQDGINALDACIQTFNGINALRQHVTPDVRIHGIIKEGGLAANVVPERAVAQFYVRAGKRSYLQEVVKKVLACAEAGAKMAGASLETRSFEYSNDDLLSNRVLGDLWVEQLTDLGIEDTEIIRNYGKEGRGSTDVGNVSHKAPTIHPSIGITGGEKVSGHSREFAACTITTDGQQATLLAAKALALSCLHLLTDETLRDKVREEFITEKNAAPQSIDLS
ncbi:MAG: M20 family metallopeptidase [Symbiobacteriaceae bacterium]|nr:M20 family metallopeptidase [Symbiobacteriaceae bacterium]